MRCFRTKEFHMDPLSERTTDNKSTVGKRTTAKEAWLACACEAAELGDGDCAAGAAGGGGGGGSERNTPRARLRGGRGGCARREAFEVQHAVAAVAQRCTQAHARGFLCRAGTRARRSE